MKEVKTKFLLTIVTVLTSYLSLAQVGTITGSVSDGATGESLPGATVLIKGTTLGAATDFDGNFTIKNVKAGTYVVDVQYISYTTKTIEKVIVIANQTTNLKVTLDTDDKKSFEAVTVTATRKTGTEMSVMTELKKADQIAVGVSATQIAKTQDRDASAVIRRVPGVSIVDGRFVVIRGLNERYNTVMLNDVITPSLEVDKKAFSFDLIPAAMIDRMLVFKSGGADIPGEFAGGVIKVYTKNIPDENFVSVSITGGYRAGTTGKSVDFNKEGGTSVLGFSHKNDLPASLSARVGSSTPYASMQSLANNWSTTPITLTPDLRLNISTGKKFKIGSIDAGNLTTLTYSNTWQQQNQQRNRWGKYSESTGKSTEIFNYQDQFTSNAVNIGLISNFNFRLNNKTSVDFRNFFNQNGRNETTLRQGYIPDEFDVRSYGFRYEQRSIYSGQLALTSNINDKDELKFTVGYGSTARTEPDYKRVRTLRPVNTNDPFQIYIPGAATTSDAARFFSNLKENTITAAGSYEHKMGELVDSDKFQDKIKVGFYAENKDRNFAARWMSYKRNVNFDNSLLNLPVDQIFAPENIGAGKFTLEEGTNRSDAYTATSMLTAGYASINKRLTDKLNAVVGVRAEYFLIDLDSYISETPLNIHYPKFSPIPSVNLAYTLSEKQTLRFAYTYSVNRPEFRELAPFSYYDFNNDANITGNANLKVATVNNLDLRWEMYPNPSEIITVGAFYKAFKNPIERFITSTNPTSLQYNYFNAESAQVFGGEVEMRKSLEDVFQNKFLQKISVLFNASIIHSNVKVDTTIEALSNQETNRALQGQAPYMVNAGLYYNNPDKGLQINLLYNVVGNLIYAVGDATINPNQYELRRNVIDLNFTKKIGKSFEIKGGVNDILNQAYGRSQDSNRDGKITTADENILNYKFGQYATLGFTYKF